MADVHGPCFFGENLRPDDHMCAVCLDVLYQPHHCVPCCHVFCEPCLRKLGPSAKCPLCRKRIETCLLDKAMGEAIRKAHPSEWELRHNVEHKKTPHAAQEDLPPLPGSAVTRRRRQRPIRKTPPRELLERAAAMLFVTFLTILCITVFVTAFSLALCYVMDYLLNLPCNMLEYLLDKPSYAVDYLTHLSLKCLQIFCAT